MTTRWVYRQRRIVHRPHGARREHAQRSVSTNSREHHDACRDDPQCTRWERDSRPDAPPLPLGAPRANRLTSCPIRPWPTPCSTRPCQSACESGWPCIRGIAGIPTRQLMIRAISRMKTDDARCRSLNSMAAGRFIAYYRVSTAQQGRSGLGLEGQRAAVAAFLNGERWQLLGEFTEVESGANNTRPELAKALSACRLKGATLVIAKPRTDRPLLESQRRFSDRRLLPPTTIALDRSRGPQRFGRACSTEHSWHSLTNLGSARNSSGARPIAW